MIKGVLFDKDGVLVDFHATWGPATVQVIDTLAEGHTGKSRALADAVDFDLDAGLHRPDSIFIAGSSRQLVEAWAPHLPGIGTTGLQQHLAMLFTEAGHQHVAAYAEVEAALAELGRMRRALGVATNDEEISARRQLGSLGLAGRFAFVAGADSGHGAKPEPGMLLAFAEHIGAEPQEVVMVGDTLHDMKAARAAGTVAVAVGTGPAELDDLAPHADHAIATLADLPSLIQSLKQR